MRLLVPASEAGTQVLTTVERVSLDARFRGHEQTEFGRELSMRIVVHGQQAFGKAVLEALLKRGENIVAVYVAPTKPGAKPDPLLEAAMAANLPVLPAGQSTRSPRCGSNSARSSPTCR